MGGRDDYRVTGPRRALLAWLGVLIGWTGAGAAYGLFVAVRMGLTGRAWDILLLMVYVGLAFGLLGSVLLGLRGVVRLALAITARNRIDPKDARSMAARVVASLGGFVLAMAVLLCIGDLVVALAFQPGTSRSWLLIRVALALATGGSLCWLLAGPLSRGTDALLARLRDPRGVKTALSICGLGLACALILPLAAPGEDRSGGERPGAPDGLRVADTGLRVVLFGLDGATWNVFGPLIEAGTMPVIAGLVRNGAVGTPLSPPPRASPITWTTIVTGHRSAQHGIQEYLLVSLPGLSLFPFESLAHDPAVLPFSFVALGYFAAQVADGIPPTSDRVRTKSLWHMLADGGSRSLVLGIPCTWPAEEVPGLIVTDRFGPNEFDMFSHHRGPLPRLVHPHEAEARLERLRTDSHGDPAPMLRDLAGFDDQQVAELAAWVYNPVIPSPLRLLTDVYDSDTTFLEIMLSELERGGYAFAIVLVNGLDLAMHAFWAERFPADFGHKKSARPEWGRLIDAYHALVDRRLGEILRASGPSTVAIVLSDSGMEASPGNLIWPGWHAEEALLIASGGPIRAGMRLESVSFVDVVPTVLYLLGFPVPADLPGRVLTEMIEPDFLQTHPVRTVALSRNAPR